MARKRKNTNVKSELKNQRENIEKMEEEIKKSKKIDKKYAKKMNNKIIENGIIAFFVMLLFYAINLGTINIEMSIYQLDLKILSLIMLGITIVLFEIAYKKDNDCIAIHSIESLFVSIIIALLYIPFKKLGIEQFRNITILCMVVTFVYYLIKSLIIYIKMKKKYFKDKNDISEIIKK